MKWGDFVIIGAVLALAGAMLAFFALRASGDTLYAEVWQDDRLVERVELTDTTDRTIDLDGHNVIVLSGNTAVMQSAAKSNISFKSTAPKPSPSSHNSI